MQELLSKLQNALPKILVVLLILLVIGFITWFIIFKTKHLKVDNLYVITGGVKTGKSFLAVYIAIRQYFKACLSYYIRHLILLELNLLTFWKIQRLVDNYYVKRPMLYSNLALRYIRFNRLTIDIIKRNVRIPNKSVLLIDEASLLADSKLFKDDTLNDELMVFVKLWGHMTHGGSLILDTQSLSDLHHSFRRCLSRYTYIYSRQKFPFVTALRLAERVYSDDNSTINTLSGDLEHNDLMLLLVPNFIYKLYDCYALSIFTDSLAFQVDYKAPRLKRWDSLKTTHLVTLHDFTTLDKRGDISHEKK